MCTRLYLSPFYLYTQKEGQLASPFASPLLGLGRIVQTEPGYQAELRFLQFPGTVFFAL